MNITDQRKIYRKCMYRSDCHKMLGDNFVLWMVYEHIFTISWVMLAGLRQSFRFSVKKHF